MADEPVYEWLTTHAHVGAAENQHPGLYAEPLFERWVDEGWEIVNVMTLPPKSTMNMCDAVGTLRRVRQKQPPSDVISDHRANHKEARELAEIKKYESNLARCYIEAMANVAILTEMNNEKVRATVDLRRKAATWGRATPPLESARRVFQEIVDRWDPHHPMFALGLAQGWLSQHAPSAKTGESSGKLSP